MGQERVLFEKDEDVPEAIHGQILRMSLENLLSDDVVDLEDGETESFEIVVSNDGGTISVEVE